MFTIIGVNQKAKKKTKKHIAKKEKDRYSYIKLKTRAEFDLKDFYVIWQIMDGKNRINIYKEL